MGGGNFFYTSACMFLSLIKGKEVMDMCITGYREKGKCVLNGCGGGDVGWVL